MTVNLSLKHRFEQFDLNVSFEAPKGLTVLFGASGSGKTTIINAIAGLLQPNHAQIKVGDTLLQDTDQGIWVPPHKRALGYIFQDSRLFPHLNVGQNLDYAGRVTGGMAARKSSVQQRSYVIDMLDIGDILKRRPATLSGGEKQRVAIGRALLASPQLILADEPLAALDAARKAEILPYFERIRDETDCPIIYVSHAASEVARLATTVVALKAGQVLRMGPALDVLADPSVMPVGVGSVGAVIEARVHAHHGDGLTELSAGGVTLYLPRLPQSLGAVVRVRLPASDVLLATCAPKDISALNTLQGQVQDIQAISDFAVLVTLKTQAGPVLARVTRRSVAALGLSVGVTCYAIAKTVAIAADDTADFT
ncbi:molybdate transport system ATP-binding protein [Pacificibacter maritimus]|uniref:Molybdate transport system ATP-binding protein n=1 Tax=Pacificibacter maritimus TaxID=762213 RepID=A0A3N4UGL7_9RHOB|nr:molybdenum ABC transporter ATP-binding protein [Pacificibacter maritimus]RPE66299.1 molybdate transport system ATP-binding protein [Pacificibacter maritimus]